MQSEIYTIILAAGKGKRMKSDTPKVLHKLCDKPIVDYVVETSLAIEAVKTIVVVGFGKEEVIAHLQGNDRIGFAVQDQLLGTADAVKRALPMLPATGTVFVLCGDAPLLKTDTLRKLHNIHIQTLASATVLTTVLDNPFGYGRIVRDAHGNVEKIVEQKDGSPNELAIREINSGTYCFDLAVLRELVEKVGCENAQREFYLTDVVRLIREKGKTVSATITDDNWEVEGINSTEQLEAMEKHLQNRRHNDNRR
jgi:bifunctional UDP-N-acetylglucosamine pyrophosphorylase / glucosamine-1-phosphate N-acetyltransferase